MRGLRRAPNVRGQTERCQSGQGSDLCRGWHEERIQKRYEGAVGDEDIRGTRERTCGCSLRRRRERR
jgi:hypothetical protein